MEKPPEERYESREQIIAQKAVIRKGDRFLIVLRSENEKAFPGLWDFPGGKLEKDEDPAQGIIRETKEETGLPVSVRGVEGTYESSSNNRPVKFVLYAVDIISGDPEQITLSEEHSASRMATAEEIHSLKTMPYMESYLSQIGLGLDS